MIPKSVRRASRAFRRNTGATTNDPLLSHRQSVHIGTGASNPHSLIRTGRVHHGLESPVVIWVIPIGDPLEYIAGHVICAIVAGSLRMGIHRHGRVVIFAIVDSCRIKVIAPRVEIASWPSG